MINHCRPSLLPWGDASIAWIAEHLRLPWLNPIVAEFTDLGEIGCVMLMLSIAYWFWNKRHAKFLCYGMFAALLINILLKGWVMECRPPQIYWLDHIKPGSYSFPSGHAQVCILLWVGLACFLKSKWQSALCVTIGILIALSRPYLGVHYIHDVVAGVLIGLSILVVCLWFDKKQIQLLHAFPLWLGSLFLFLFLALYSVLVNNPSGSSIIATSGCFGFWLGCQWEQKYCQFVPSQRLIYVFAQMCIGCLGIFILLKGGNLWRSTLDSSIATSLQYLQYMLLGLWISFGAPLVFIKCKLMTKERITLSVP